MNRQSSALAKHLCRSYEFDAELGDGSEKRMEGLMYNFEAVLRIALEGQVIEPSKFYVTVYIGQEFKSMSLVAAPPTDGGPLVTFPKDFSDIDLVIDLLEKGTTVVSEQATELCTGQAGRCLCAMQICTNHGGVEHDQEADAHGRGALGGEEDRHFSGGVRHT